MRIRIRSATMFFCLRISYIGIRVLLNAAGNVKQVCFTTSESLKQWWLWSKSILIWCQKEPIKKYIILLIIASFILKIIVGDSTVYFIGSLLTKFKSRIFFFYWKQKSPFFTGTESNLVLACIKIKRRNGSESKCLKFTSIHRLWSDSEPQPYLSIF